MTEPQIQTQLPDNAYRELRPGETYTPMVPPSARVPEVTTRSVLFGIAMCVLFSMAASYLALKVGQGIETAIPISVLALGLSTVLVKVGQRRSTILENVNVLAISTASGIVAGGSVFSMPALYLLKLNENLKMSNTAIFLQIAFVPFLGAVLGVLFLIPFRRYFVREMHGKLPFPEGTATNEILVTGESGGKNSIVLIYSFAISGIYALIAGAWRLFPENFTTGRLEYEMKIRGALDTAGKAVAETSRSFEALAFSGTFGTTLYEKLKVVFSLGTGAEFVGLGYIIGLRYASIICAGSFLSWFVIVPLLAPLDYQSLKLISPAIEVPLMDGIPSVATAPAEIIFAKIAKNMGIGCIFAAGLLSILKMSKVIVTALREAIGGLFRGGATRTMVERTEEDISYLVLLIIGLVVTAAMAVYFYFVVFQGMPNSIRLTTVAVLLALGVSFIFTTVSAWAIATISVTPISGMTVTTIIITAIALMAAGLQKGDRAQLAVLLVGGVVATALSMAGTLVTEFKIGYWTGATPRRIQWSAMIAAALASVVVAMTIMILAKNPGYNQEVNPQALAAPQANLMKSALESFVGTGQVPWLTYAVGVAIALSLQLIGISPLAFGLGMYLSMWLNTPILVGAIVAAIVPWGGRDEATRKARNDKGILLASGLIAGAAVIGVIVKGLQAWPATEGFMDRLDWYRQQLSGLPSESPAVAHVLRHGNWIGLIAFIAICLFVFFDARRAKPSGEMRNVIIPGH